MRRDNETGTLLHWFRIPLSAAFTTDAQNIDSLSRHPSVSARRLGRGTRGVRPSIHRCQQERLTARPAGVVGTWAADLAAGVYAPGKRLSD